MSRYLRRLAMSLTFSLASPFAVVANQPTPATALLDSLDTANQQLRAYFDIADRDGPTARAFADALEREADILRATGPRSFAEAMTYHAILRRDKTPESTTSTAAIAAARAATRSLDTPELSEHALCDVGALVRQSGSVSISSPPTAADFARIDSSLAPGIRDVRRVMSTTLGNTKAGTLVRALRARIGTGLRQLEAKPARTTDADPLVSVLANERIRSDVVGDLIEFTRLAEALRPVRTPAEMISIICDALHPGEAVVYWHDAPVGDTTWAAVLRPAQDVTWISLGTETPEHQRVRDRVSRRLAAAAAWPTVVDVDPDLAGDLASMWDVRVKPLLGALAGTHTLIVPIGSGPAPILSALSPPGSDRLGFAVACVPSASWLADVRSSPRRPPDTESLILGAASVDNLQARPFVDAEIIAVRRALNTPLDFTDIRADEGVLRDHVEGDFIRSRLAIHLTAPVRENARFPEHTAWVIRPTTNGRVDGLITAHDVLWHWSNRVEVVSLSGGPSLHAPQVAAMLASGAGSVLLASRLLIGEPMALLMATFHELWTDGTGRSKAAALSDAQKWLRTYQVRDGSTPFAHPAYGSSIVLVGDPD